MSAEENKRVVRALVDALNARDWDAFSALVDEGCEWTVVPSDVTWRGPLELVENYQAFTSALPDLRVEILTLVAEGDLVANEWRASGTHKGALKRPEGEFPPTGRSFTRSGVGMVELRDGKIIGYRDHLDRLMLFEQLGLGTLAFRVEPVAS